MLYLLGYLVAVIAGFLFTAVRIQRPRGVRFGQSRASRCLFDLDGTLHQQDMFGTFMRYLLRRQPLNALLVLPLLPLIGIALLVKAGRRAGR